MSCTSWLTQKYKKTWPMQIRPIFWRVDFYGETKKTYLLYNIRIFYSLDFDFEFHFTSVFGGHLHNSQHVEVGLYQQSFFKERNSFECLSKVNFAIVNNRNCNMHFILVVAITLLMVYRVAHKDPHTLFWSHMLS